MHDQIQTLKEKAEELYKTGQYLCSEAIFIVVNEYLGQPISNDAVKLASGFPVGMGGAGCACGALTGGVMALGLKYGRTLPGQEAPDMFPKAKELHDWFKKEFKSTCCSVLIKKVEFGGQEHIDQCTRITGAVAEKVLKLL
ncbi:MAG: C-GCAxxG-C-C family protein [Candidatus Saccharibacteria bacterium]